MPARSKKAQSSQLSLDLTPQEPILPSKSKASIAPQNTRTQLSSLIKSARDIMRKDAGLNGDLDRLPQLSWMMFLKCYDDLEKRREELALLEGKALSAGHPRALPLARLGRRPR